MPGQLGHERADDGAIAGEDCLHRDRTVVDPLHHLDLVADDVARCCFQPVSSSMKKVVLPESP